MAQVVFNTDRLIVRRWKEDDLSSIVSVYGDHDAMRWVADGNAISREDCERWIEVTQNNYRTRGYGMFAVVAKHHSTVVGFCGLVHPGGQVEPEIKYAYHRTQWGQGFATEAAYAMLRYGARTHGLQRIIATASPANIASHKVLLKAGMQQGGLCTNGDGSKTQLFFWHRPEGAA